MPHVSKKRLKKAVARELADQLLLFLSRVEEKEGHMFVRELLSQTERVMLAKRLAIIIFLVHGYTFDQIEDSLKVTSQTVARMWRGLKNGEYRGIAQSASKKGDIEQESAFEALIRLLHMGLPPRAGPGRRAFWKKTFGGG